MIKVLFFSLPTLFFTRWWSPSLRGLPDIIGLIPLICLLYIITTTSFIKKVKFSKLILIGFLAYLPFLSRRWYAYAVVAFYLSVLVISLFEFLKLKDGKKEAFKMALRNFFFSGVTTLLLVFVLQTPLAMTIISENYANTYSAFQVDLVSHITNFYNEFGFIVIFLAVIGIVLSILFKKRRKIVVYSLLNIAIFSLLFCRTQAMGVHHYLGISLYIFLLFVIGIINLLESINHPKLKILLAVLILFITFLNFISTFFIKSINIPLFLQNNKYYKFKYDNYENLISLRNDLDKLLESNDKFIVTASSGIISDSLLDVIGTDNIKKSVIYNSTVDLRDKIKLDGLLAKYVVVSSPEQYEMNKDGQQVMLYTNELILENKGLGKAYKRIGKEYVLSNNVKAYIYEKERAFTYEEVSEYLDHFIELYPQWKNEINEFHYNLLMGTYNLPVGLNNFLVMDYDTIYFHPGNESTILELPNTLDNIKLKLYIDPVVNRADEDAGIVKVEIHDQDKLLFSKEISPLSDETVTLDLKNSEKLIFNVSAGDKLDCDWLYIDVLEV